MKRYTLLVLLCLFVWWPIAATAGNGNSPVDSQASPVVLGVLTVLGVLVVLAALLAVVVKLHVRSAVRYNTSLHDIMTRALGMGDYYVLEYDIKTKHVRNVYNNLLPDDGMDESEFLSRFPDDQRDYFYDQLRRLEAGEVEEWTLRRKWNVGTPGRPVYREFDGSAILERERGVPRYVFHAFRDITHSLEEEAYNQEQAAVYMKTFDTNLVAMSFYTADGRLISYNQKMRQLLNMTPESEKYFYQDNLFNDDFTRDFIRPGRHETYHVCGHLTYPTLGIDKYIESRLVPIFNDLDELTYYIVACRDVTAERDLYMKQLEHDAQLEQANERIMSYEWQLRYLLEESKMYVFRLDIKKGLITFSQNLRQADYTETIDEYFDGLVDGQRDAALSIMEDNIKHGKPFVAIREFDHTPVSDGHVWHSFSAIPLFDADGQVTHYFGFVRDISDLMTAQQKLREETARAEDSGLLKAAFLANMTHEIRTPLNAIVGFSDILQMVDAGDERMEMIRIIRSNCDMLLRLINDILEASDMGQSLVIQPEVVDLPKVFDDICITLAQRVQEVPFVKDNPEATYAATIDKGRLQQLLTNFVTNAVKYTHEGHIRVGWQPVLRDGIEGMYFYCEDTGAGIPKDKQTAVFDRFVKLNDFVQGTGLGLSICKAIVEKCNGHIGVTSQGEGHGSTFWFWIPRNLS